MSSSGLVRPFLAPMTAALAIVALGGGSARAQDAGSLTGRVLSTIGGEGGDPVPGVTLRLSGVRDQSLSNDAGRFRFRAVAAGSHELRAELFGCVLATRTVEVRPDETTTVDLQVSRPAIEIPGLVVTGTAAETPEAQRSFTVDEVDVEGREGRISRSIADLIRGEFPGVRIRQGGLAGGEISIQLRGPSSITGSQHPLVVIDGVITVGEMIDLNPGDVQSVRVLKGASAAAEYGSRGEAGVIEITTRGAGPEPPIERGPLVVVDGEISTDGLGAIDPGEIAHTELITGARARVLFGTRAGERGVLRITTRDADAGGTGQRLSRCAPPPP